MTQITNKQAVDAQAEVIRQASCDKVLFDQIQSPHTHTVDHIRSDPPDLLNMILRLRDWTERTRMSAFHGNKNHINACIDEAILFASVPISQWVVDAQPGEQHAFFVHLDEEDYGYLGDGYVRDTHTNQIQAVKSNTICLVLQKDDQSAVGFSLVTAYPDLLSPQAEVMDQDITRVLKQTDTYKKANAFERRLLLFWANNEKPYLLHMEAPRPYQKDPYLECIIRHKQIKHIFQFNKQGSSWKAYNADGQKVGKVHLLNWSDFNRTHELIYHDRNGSTEQPDYLNDILQYATGLTEFVTQIQRQFFPTQPEKDSREITPIPSVKNDITTPTPK